MTSKTCTVKIINKAYQIKCPEGEEGTLQLAAAKLNQKINTHKNKFKTLDNYQVLLLAALELGHELVVCQQEQEHQRHQVSQLISSLERKINKTVEGAL